VLLSRLLETGKRKGVFTGYYCAALERDEVYVREVEGCGTGSHIFETNFWMSAKQMIHDSWRLILKTSSSTF
jgi:hypothetical protein